MDNDKEKFRKALERKKSIQSRTPQKRSSQAKESNSSQSDGISRTIFRRKSGSA